MSGLQYSNYPGAGEWLRDNLGYSQAVRVADRIECSGQGESWWDETLACRLWELTCGILGGWDPEAQALNFPTDLADEINQAFKNVEITLRNAGGKGWSQVYRVNSYHTDLSPELTALMTQNFGKWMPDHKSIWTMIGVKQLGAPDMHVEIEVVAYDP